MNTNKKSNLYNEEQKMNFIKDYQGNSKDTYVRNIFGKIESEESFKEKDICEFNEKEILEVLKSFNTSSVNSLRVKCSILRSYAAWCERKGLIKNNMNCFNNVYGEDIDKCVNKEMKKSKLMSYERLLSLCNDLPNPVDQFILLGIFEGMKGKRLIELTSLRLKDLHEDYFDLPTRKIKVTTKLYAVAMEAATTDIYVTLRGRYQEKNLLQCDYVFKPKATACVEISLEEDNYARIRKRMSNIKEVLDEPELTVASLYYSGMIHYMNKIAEEKGIDLLDVINVPEYEQIKDKYQITLPNYAIKANIKGYLL